MLEEKTCTIAFILGTQIFIVSILGGLRFFLFVDLTVLHFLMYST